MRHTVLACVFLLLSYSTAQTITAVDDAGDTVVEVVTTNALGVRTTQIIQTVAQIQPPAQKGPVGAPAPTQGTPHAPIPYIYYTTNQAGRIITMSDTFTPTFPRGDTPPSLSTGTQLQYSDWLTIVGTNTVPPKQAARNAGSNRWGAGFGAVWLGTSFGIVGGLLCGAWLVLL